MFNKKSNTTIDYMLYISIVLFLFSIFLTINIRFTFDGSSTNTIYSNSLLDTFFYDNCFSEKHSHIEEEKFKEDSIQTCFKRFFSENFYGQGSVLSLKILNEKYEEVPSKSFFISSTVEGILVKESSQSEYFKEDTFFIKKERLCQGESLNERCFELIIPISYIEEEVVHNDYFLHYTLLFI